MHNAALARSALADEAATAVQVRDYCLQDAEPMLVICHALKQQQHHLAAVSLPVAVAPAAAIAVVGNTIVAAAAAGTCDGGDDPWRLGSQLGQRPKHAVKTRTRSCLRARFY